MFLIDFIVFIKLEIKAYIIHIGYIFAEHNIAQSDIR
jgi:hypothetical protein